MVVRELKLKLNVRQEQLKVREWECSSCGEVHDRDKNSAKVILALGLGTNLVPDVMLGLNRNFHKGCNHEI